MEFDRDTIPAFLSIDVEPDAFQIARGRGDHWSGYAATWQFMASLRTQIARTSGVQPIFGWYYRTDPQIEAVCGRADFALTAHADRVAALREEGDYFGVHAHPLRWCEERRLWVHDFDDRRWVRDSTQFALDAFEGWNGSPAELFRYGAGFLSNDIVDVLDQNGVAAELSLEPVAGLGLHKRDVPTAVDYSPMVGEYSNCAAAPKTPYHPSYEDFLKPDAGALRRILLIPLSTGTSMIAPRGRFTRIKRWLHRASEAESVRMLYPGAHWEAGFWNVVSHQLGSMERPYLSLAVRTDRVDSINQKRVVRVLTDLIRHPIVKRLRFVHPLEVKDEITPCRAVAARHAASIH
jgi:hypothetical protein